MISIACWVAIGQHKDPGVVTEGVHIEDRFVEEDRRTDWEAGRTSAGLDEICVSSSARLIHESFEWPREHSDTMLPQSSAKGNDVILKGLELVLTRKLNVRLVIFGSEILAVPA